MENGHTKIWRVWSEHPDSCLRALRRVLEKTHLRERGRLITEKQHNQRVVEITNKDHRVLIYFSTLTIPKENTFPSPPTASPRIALVIDDLGNQTLPTFFQTIGIPCAGAVLPHTPFAYACAAKLHRLGKEVLLHLPMEPEGYPQINPGPGVLLVSMHSRTIWETLRGDLESVPYIVGINNHTGSRASQDAKLLEAVFTYLEGKDLFFLDSRTTSHSLIPEIARKHGIPILQRQVFLDDLAEPVYIQKEFYRAVALAKKQGYCIAIGHPHRATFRVLEREIPKVQGDIAFAHLQDLLKETLSTH